METQYLADTGPFKDIYSLLSPDKSVDGRLLTNAKNNATYVLESVDNYVAYRLDGKWAPHDIVSRKKDNKAFSKDFGRLYLLLAYKMHIQCHPSINGKTIADIDKETLGYSAEMQKCISLINSELLNATNALSECCGDAMRHTAHGNVELSIERQIQCLSIASSKECSSKSLSTSAESSSWVAMYADPATVSRLTVTLFGVHGEEPTGSKELTLTLCPTLLTSLDWFLEDFEKKYPKKRKGWWKTLDDARDWAIKCYKESAVADPSANGLLSGEYIARWDLNQGLMRQLSEEYSASDAAMVKKYRKEVDGTSHGAAFALCLVQALAREHLAGPRPPPSSNASA